MHAFECYLKARRHICEMTESSLNQAVEDIERAEEIVGENALLLASKAYAYWQYYNAGLRPDPAYLDRAEALVRRMMAIDPGAEHVNLLRGLIALQRGDTGQAIRHLRLAVEQDRDVEGLAWLIVSLVIAGGIDEARRLAERLQQLDPLSWTSHIARVAVELYGGEFARALDYVAALTPADTEVPIGGLIVLQVYAQLERIDEAAHMARSMAERQPGDLFARTAAVVLDALAGRAEAARAGLTADLLASARADAQYSQWIAEVFALLGDRDAALEWLAHAIARGFLNYPFLAHHDRLLIGVRDDPRFAALMLDLRDQWAALT